jgi:cell volume regulation protein A
VTLVLRDGVGFVPGADTRLKVGDSLLIVATAGVRDETERRLRAVSRRGRLARWFGEYGEEPAR